MCSRRDLLYLFICSSCSGFVVYIYGCFYCCSCSCCCCTVQLFLCCPHYHCDPRTSITRNLGEKTTELTSLCHACLVSYLSLHLTPTRAIPLSLLLITGKKMLYRIAKKERLDEVEAFFCCKFRNDIEAVEHVHVQLGAKNTEPLFRGIQSVRLITSNAS